MVGLAGEDPQVILWWARGKAERMVQVSSFDLEDQVVTHLLYRVLGYRVPVLFVDTMHHFPETLDVVEKTIDEFRLDIRVYGPRGVETRESFEAAFGDGLRERDPRMFHEVTLEEPFARGLLDLGADAWVSGRRGGLVFEWDDGRLRVNPLALWTRDQVWQYVRDHRLPYNVLYDRGYHEIGEGTAVPA